MPTSSSRSGLGCPRSDLHVAAAFELAGITGRVGIVYKDSGGDATVENWGRLATRVEVLEASGVPLAPTGAIHLFWSKVRDFVEAGKLLVAQQTHLANAARGVPFQLAATD